MKVSILTYHNAHNYGAVLQAYALRTKLRDLGYDAQIANYRNDNIEKRYERDLKYTFTYRELLNPLKWHKLIKRRYDIEFAKEEWAKQCDNFKEFIYDYLLEKDDNRLSLIDLENLDTDMFICGSDQVWASWITDGLDSAYLLSFNTNARRVSYAASMASADISLKEKEVLKAALNDFDDISVREKEVSKVLQKLVNKNIEVTLDPTLLIDGKDYENIESKNELTKEKFVFAYFVHENDILMECAKECAKSLGYKLIELHYYLRRDLLGHNQIADAGPSEFLWYIKNAEFVLTNSFHGTVFSILYKKRFYSVYEKDLRKDNLLNSLELEDRHINCAKDMDFKSQINYENAFNKLEAYRKSSIDFLVRQNTKTTEEIERDKE